MEHPLEDCHPIGQDKSSTRASRLGIHDDDRFMGAFLQTKDHCGKSRTIVLLLRELTAHPVATTTGVCLLALLGYIAYQRFLHPLAKYPGPFLASLTDLWQVHQFMTLRQPCHLTELHQKYGPIVRYGPGKLSITEESAIPLIYQKGSRMMPKTEFYDA